MRTDAPFQPDDLAEFDAFLASADAVVPMEDVADGLAGVTAVGLRHDVDNEIESAVQMARWEEERGYRSTFFVLHGTAYWQDKNKLRSAVEAIADCGHEIGFHLNAITEAIRTGRNPVEIAAEAVGELRDYGYPVRGVVAHGDPACYVHNFVNDELFTQSARPDYGQPRRRIANLDLRPVSRAALGFDYDPNWLPRAAYLSDSGGHWSTRFEDVAAGFPFAGQLFVLQHPCWWPQSFTAVEAAA